ncbi:S1C family serine protease [Rhizobacter sp. J219]|uniref:S1C family serine protease n=1 Tax=Rhizobacter sp. J219 TaxID=2898430 RepID=UPI002151316B|nr:S1C family serine protease [Rhizobacter sp. J219]MCR5881928.1 S1C family serine protease [Rhizobacter sp. J219]
MSIEIGRRRLLERAGAGVLSLGLSGCVRPTPPDVATLIARATPSVVGVGDGSGVSGSGFVLAGTRWVVSAAHVLRSLNAPLKITSAGVTTHARLHALDEAADLALLRLTHDVAAPGLALADTAATVGQWAVVLGCPFGTLPTATLGIVSALPGAVLEPAELRRRLQLNAAVNPGNSGGPVLDLGGRVIGVANATVPGGYGLGFAVPAHDVQALLDLSGDLNRTGRGS